MDRWYVWHGNAQANDLNTLMLFVFSAGVVVVWESLKLWPESAARWVRALVVIICGGVYAFMAFLAVAQIFAYMHLGR